MGSINSKEVNKMPIPSRDSIGYNNLKEKLKQLREEISDNEFVIIENKSD